LSKFAFPSAIKKYTHQKVQFSEASATIYADSLLILTLTVEISTLTWLLRRVLKNNFAFAEEKRGKFIPVGGKTAKTDKFRFAKASFKAKNF
jgi:hypothetical protein